MKVSDEDSLSSSQAEKEEEVPVYGCAYCGIHSFSSVVKCNNKACLKWFCNERMESNTASHIVVHLVKSHHNQIATHPEGEFGDLAIECFLCANTNVFVLGFVFVKEEGSVLFVCRDPCVRDWAKTDYQWDPCKWEPIIRNKELVEWIAQKVEVRNQFADQDIMRLQEAWKSNPKLKFNQIVKKKVYKKLKPIQMKYRNGKQYRAIFEQLLKEQAEIDHKLKESQTQSNMQINIVAANGKKHAYFLFGSREDFDSNMLPGNELKISHENWHSKGVVVKITGNEEVCLQLFNHEPHPTVNYPFKVQLIWKPSSYNRMKKGLRQFQNVSHSISSYLYYSILGIPCEKKPLNISLPQKLEVPGLPKLNYYQQEALKFALVQPLCLIQGPPGTGKTITSASIVYHLVQRTKKQILVCAPSNVVVDMLAMQIHLTGVKTLRFCSKIRESVSSDVEHLTLHNKIKNNPQYQALRLLCQKNEKNELLTPQQQSKMKELKKKAEYQTLQKAQVVCTTCIASADRRLQDFYFHHVVIDEATQAIEPQCLLPLTKSAKQMILVGDHLQLGPVVIGKETARAGLNKGLFERLVKMGHKPMRLQVQYRMHPHLTLFPSNTFYDGTLQNGITERDRKVAVQFPWPNNKPSFFLNLYGSEELSSSGTSYLNRTEASVVDKVVFYLERAGVEAKQIGIITPYKGQKAFIINYLLKNGQILTKNPNYYKEIEVASVDGYQGREKDYIIVSCVRSNDGPGIGFLKDPRRMNVTITRAKYGLIVLGNAKVLYEDSLWNNLLHHFKDNETLVEGNIPHFRPSLLVLPPKQKYSTREQDQNQELFKFPDENNAREQIQYENVPTVVLNEPLGKLFAIKQEFNKK